MWGRKKGAWTDRDMLTDLMHAQDLAISCRSADLTEFTDPQRMRQMTDLFAEEYQIRQELYAEMKKRGWAKSCQAPAQAVQQFRRSLAAGQLGREN